MSARNEADLKYFAIQALRILAQREPELFKEFDEDSLDEFINDIAEAWAQNIASTNDDRENSLSLYALVDDLRANPDNPKTLQFVFTTLTIEAVLKKYDPENKGLDKLSPQEKIALRDELKKVLGNVIGDMKDEKEKDLLVDRILDEVLGKDFAPRPNPDANKFAPRPTPDGANKKDEDEEEEEKKKQQVYSVQVTDDVGNVIGSKGGFTSDPTARFDKISNVLARGEEERLLQLPIVESLVEALDLSMSSHLRPTPPK